jgi:hypothetical protein
MLGYHRSNVALQILDDLHGPVNVQCGHVPPAVLLGDGYASEDTAMKPEDSTWSMAFEVVTTRTSCVLRNIMT